MTRALAFASVFAMVVGIGACKKSRPKEPARPATKPQSRSTPARPASASTAKPVSWRPKGVHSLTPTLVVRSAAKAIDFYKRAFGARELYRMKGLDGKSIMHAELLIGDSHLYLSDESPMDRTHVSPEKLGGKTSVSLNLYVPDVDATVAKAIAAGARQKMPATDMFWGDRYASVIDPFGHKWGVLTHKVDLTPEQMKLRGKRWMAAWAKKMKAKKMKKAGKAPKQSPH